MKMSKTCLVISFLAFLGINWCGYAQYWTNVGNGVNGTVLSLAKDKHGNIFVGGQFTEAGSNQAFRIAKWDRISWTNLGSGVNNEVVSMVCDTNENLYVGGWFTNAGGVGVSYIAKWNGESWTNLGEGFNSAVGALACDDSNNIYAGGLFTNSGSLGCYRIAKWNGTYWTNLSSGIGGEVCDIVCDGVSDVYAGGNFTTAGGSPANYVAKWDGNSWTNMSDGPGGRVESLALDNNNTLYVGGWFTGGVKKWDGVNWTNLLVGVDNKVYGIACDSNNNLYAGGSFNVAGLISASKIARWNGSSWTNLSSGMDNTVSSMALDSDGHLYAGGLFSHAGGSVSLRIAEWVFPSVPEAPDTVVASDGLYTNKISVRWSAVPDATVYQIWRNTANLSAGASLIGQSVTTNYDDLSVLGMTLYYYWVKATNTVGSSELSLSDSGYAQLEDSVTNILWAWGRNEYGQLGLGDTTNRLNPAAVLGLTNVLALPVGSNYSVTLLRDGTVMAWGGNNSGQLGLGDTTNRLSPVAIPGLTNVIAVGGGVMHTLALLNDGTVKAWGNNYYGRLGLGDTTNRLSPVLIPGLTNVISIISGGEQALALLNNGTVMAWGRNDIDGQLGLGDMTNRLSPVAIPGLTNVASINVGGNRFFQFALALLNDGTVMAWGGNSYGQLGLGDTTRRLNPVLIPGLTNVAAITAGGQNQAMHTLALLHDGTVKAWGYNGSGQLGVGDTTNRLSPVVVPGLTNVVTIDGAYHHTLALLGDGTVKAWGYNYFGQLGVGDTTNRLSPVVVPGLRKVTAIVARNHYSFALYRGETNALPLPAPSNLTASDGLYTDKVVVSWSPSLRATGYQLRRGTNSAFEAASIVTNLSGMNNTNFIDSACAEGFIYYYWVMATNICGASAPSDDDTGYRSITEPSAPTDVYATDGTYSDKVHVIWVAASGATGYQVWRSSNPNTASATLLGSTTGTLFDDTNVPEGITHYYWVKATNAAGVSAWSDYDTGYRLTSPSTPASLFASDGTYTDKVAVAWSGVSGATGYQVWRGLSSSTSSASLLAKTSFSAIHGTLLVGNASYCGSYWLEKCACLGVEPSGRIQTPDLTWHRAARRTGVSCLIRRAKG